MPMTVYVVVDGPRLWDAQTRAGQFNAGVFAMFSTEEKAEEFKADYARLNYAAYPADDVVHIYSRQLDCIRGDGELVL